MRHDETRDNTTAIENQIIEADKRAREESAPYPPAYPFPVFGGEPEKIIPVIVTVDELPPSDYPKPYNPQHVVDGVVVEDVDDDIEEDDGQPSEYDEWQDYMGGDEYYDHSESVWGEGY